MTRLVLVMGSIFFCTIAVAHGHEDDRKIAEKNGWVYDDLQKGITEAQRTGKPLMVVIRCPP